MIRISKIIAKQTNFSRRKAEELMLEWAVFVNWEKITEMGSKADPEKDKITIDWKVLEREERNKKYFAFNKPIWVICSTKREWEDEIIMDYFPRDLDVFPVWRLDKETTGLILMTNDWDLAFKLTHPSFEKEKEYEVLVTKKLNPEVLDKLSWWGMAFLWRKVLKAKVFQKSSRSFWIVLKEWMNRQIRRMVRNIGFSVEKLRRIRVENIFLWELKIWEKRSLNKKELEELKKRFV